MKHANLSPLLFLVPIVYSAPLEARLAICRDVTFQVSGSALNRNLTSLNFADPNATLAAFKADAFPLVPVNGTQTLAGTFCLPTVLNENLFSLQVLFHPITGNRGYWNGLGGLSTGYVPYQPQNYSWVEFAHANGYPTLALDRLGAGESSHPDPVAVVQGPYEFALYHDLATQLRAGTTGQFLQPYEKLIFVGHSYGSEIGNAMAQLYPKDFEALILTGFSKSVLPSFFGVVLQTPEPAAVENPAKFGTLPAGYLTAPVEKTHTDSFFGSPAQAHWDPQASHLYWVREDVVSVGQFVSVYVGITEAPAYKGRVLVLTGEEDQAFCGPGSPVLGPAQCGSLLPDTQTLFPNADYNWHSVPATGHAINYHYSAQAAFGVAHQFLAGRRFDG